MTLPRITGLLHNCALNSALPILLNGIEKLAIHEAEGTLDTVTDNLIVQNYLRFKNTFASHYGLEGNESFTWYQFHNFLNKHSFYAKEIIFAPVFRKFIGEEGLNTGVYPEIALLRDIQEDGLYNDLGTREVASLFHNLFGISVTSYEYTHNNETGNPEDNYAARDICTSLYADYPFGENPTLKLYLKDEHFEIQPHESLTESNRVFVEEIRTLPRPLAAIHNALSFSETARQSNRCLDDLCLYVQTDLTLQLEAVEHRKLNFRESQNRFNVLLADLDLITDRLRKKEKENPVDYGTVRQTAQSLHRLLQKKSNNFFANPTSESFELFKGECRILMADAENEFKNHRGNSLVDGILAIMKGILGVLAALTVIPALIVESTFKRGYVKTFFSSETVSAQQFAEVKEDYNDLEQEIGALVMSR